jgi:pentatricopeptide repeat protein
MQALCLCGPVRDALVVLDDMLCRGCAPDVVELMCAKGYRPSVMT